MLPDKFYDEIVRYYTERKSADHYEQLEWLNANFPEANWHYDENANNIYPIFKSSKHETMFMLRWS